MNRVFIGIMVYVPLMFCACEETNVSNDVYTEYNGVELSQVEQNRGIMNEMLNLIEQQGGEFSAEDLLDALSTKQIKCGAIYYVDDSDAEACVWRNVGEMDGYKTPGDILADDGGALLFSHKMDVTYNYWFEGNIAHYLAEQGYDGWYSTHRWSYNADTNVFATIVNGKEEIYEAEVLYFDGGKLFLKGKIGGVHVGATQYDNLYRFELTDKHESFFERRTSGEKYYNIWDTYCKANGIENEFSLLFFTNVYY